MKLLIIDPDVKVHHFVKQVTKKYNYIDLMFSDSIETAIEMVNSNRPEVVTLNFRLNNNNGFGNIDAIKKILNEPIMIVYEGYEKDAVKAFEENIFDFFTESAYYDRFLRGLEDAIEENSKRNESALFNRIKNVNEEIYNSKLPVKEVDKTVFIPHSQIMYIAADRYYAEIFILKGSKKVVRHSLNKLEEILDQQKFQRIHRSSIVNLDFVKEVLHNDYAQIDLKMKNEEILRVSRSYKKEVLEALNMM